ncbi:unnamed protein product [Closterium sp. Naga37s-1]|nr:unnamed protein product [Closterium sp. Naga37s-1]
MYALPTSAEGACYLCVPPDPGIQSAALGAGEAAALGAGASPAPGAGEAAALGARESTAPGTGESALSGAAPAAIFYTFTLDSGASRSFFRDRTTLTPLSRPVAVSLADPSGGPVLAHYSTVLPCPAAPSGSLLGLYLPSFSTNLVSGADLQDGGVDQFTPASQRVTHCTCARTGRHLATFTRQPGSSLYTLTTESPSVPASSQVAASSQVFAAASRSGLESAPCSCRLLSHQTLLWHHRLGHPSLPRLRGMASRVLVSSLPRSLPPLPPGPAPTCVPCVEGRQRAAPHSSEFPPTEAPLQTLHMDVWGPARVRGQGHERYFLLVVDDYSRYTSVFPLRRKGEVTEVLIDWIRAARLQLRESFGSDFPVLRLHSDKGGEFSSDLLRAFCRAEGIRQTFTLPASPQQNGIAERRNGMIMDVARTSMIHAAAPHFLWPFAVQYAAHQINLQPRVSMPETSPTLRWTGKVGDASAFRVWGSRAFVRHLSADKLSSRAVPCVFLGFPPDAPGWQFYHHTSRRVLSSQDVTFDESVPYYHPLPPQGPAPSGVSQVDAIEPVEVAVDSGAARGAAPAGAESGGAEHERAEPGGAGTGGAEPGVAESGGAEPGGAEPGGPSGARTGGTGAAGPGGSTGAGPAGGAGAGGAAGVGAAGGTGADAAPSSGGPFGAGAVGGSGAGGAAGAGAGGSGAGGATGAGAPGAAGVGGAGAAGGATGAGGAAGVGADAGGAGAVPAGSGGAARPRPYFVPLLEQVLGLPPSSGPSPALECPPSVPSVSQLQLACPLPAPSPYTGPTGGLAERRAPAFRPASPVRAVRASRRVPRQRPPAVPGTHQMALRPSTAPQRVPLPSPPESSLPALADPGSDSLRAASPTVTRLLATVVTDPSFESTAASALVAELVDFAAHCRLDYAASLVAESESVCPPSVGGLAIGWMRGATHTETIVMSPDFFTVTISSLGADKHRQGSTPWVRAIMVQDLDSPQPLPPPPVHSIVASGPFPPPAPAMHSSDAAASPRVPAGFQPELVCAIVDAQQEYHFGKLLNNAEKYWVVGKLSHHLHTMRMHPAQHWFQSLPVRLPPSSSGSAASSASNRDVPAAGAAASVTKADVKKTDVPLESARTAANVSPAVITAPIVRPDIFSDAAATPSATAAAPDPSPDASSATGSISRKASNESRTNESVQAGSSGADETGSKKGSLHARQAGTSKRVAFALPSLETGEPAKGFTKAVGGAADGDGGDKREAGTSPLPAIGSRPSESQPSDASSLSTSPPAENPIETALAVASDWLRRQGIGVRAVAAIDHAIHNMGPAAQGAAQAGRQLWAAHGRQAVGEVVKWPMLAHVCIGVGLTFLLCQTGFLLSLLLLPWAVLYFWLLWTHHYERLKVAVRAAVRIEQLMSRAMPEAETAFWASVLLSKAWPLFLNDLVSTKLMPKVAPWFLSRYKPPMLAKVEVVKANFGDTAPVITSIKAFREGGGRNHVELEASVELVGADNLSVQATAYVAGMASIPWTAYITGLQLTGTMRVGLRFRRSLPFVDRVTLSFVRPPQVSCAIKVMGALDAASMPLVASYVDYTLQNALKTSLCWPNRLVVVDAVRAAAFVLDLPVPPPTPEEISIVTPRPVTKSKSTISAISKKFLSKKGPTAALPAVATLLVEVIEAKDLLAADSGGTSDPYVKGSIGAARFQTAVISKNLNPQWKQKFEVPVADWSLPESYTLVLRVKDYDMFSANDAIGRAQMDISAVRGAGRKEEWLSLVDGGNGKIRVAVEVKEDGGVGPSGSDSDPAGPSAVAAGGSAGGESGGAAVGGRGVERAASDASTSTLESYTHDSQSVSPARSEDAARVAAPTTATVVPRSATSEVPPSPSLTPSSSSSAKSSSSWFRGLSSTSRGSRNSRSGSSATSSQPTSLDETTPGATTPKEITPAPKTPKEGTPRSGSRSWSFKSGSLRRLGSGSGASLSIAVATVHVEVIEADSLVAADKIGTSDPYLKGSLGSSKFSTKIIFKTLCPRWNEKFSLPVKEWPPAGSPFLLKLNIFDRDMLTQHDPLGNAALDIMPLRDGARHALWVKLENVATGRVHVAVTVEDHMGQAETDDEENESVEGGEEGGDGKAGVISAPTSAAQLTPAPESPSRVSSRSSKKPAGKAPALSSIPSGQELSAMADAPAASSSSYGPSSPPAASDSPVAGKGGTGEAGEAGGGAEGGWESDAQGLQGVEKEVPQVWVAHVEIIEATDLVVADMTGKANVNLNVLRDGQRHALWLPLQGVKSGKVHVAVTLKEQNVESNVVVHELMPGCVIECYDAIKLVL